MEWRRHLGSAALMAVFLVFNTATSKDPASSAPSGSSSASSASGVVGAPADLDAARVAAALGCPGQGGDACRVLEEFKSAGSIAEPSEDQEVYVGYSYGQSGKSAVREYFFLQLKRGAVQAPPGVPAAAVLPYGGAARSLIPDNPAEDKDSAALVAALKAGGKSPQGSKAAEFVRTAKPPEGFRSMARTAGASQMITASGSPFVFIRRSGDRVLVVEYERGNALSHARSTGASPAWVAELWRLR